MLPRFLPVVCLIQRSLTLFFTHMTHTTICQCCNTFAALTDDSVSHVGGDLSQGALAEADNREEMF